MTVINLGINTFRKAAAGGVLFLAFLAWGCTPTSIGGGNTNSNTDGLDDGGNALLNEPLGFEGTVSGKVLDTQTTRASTDVSATGQDLPPDIDTASTCVRFKDVLGSELLDEAGAPYGDFPLNTDGTFNVPNLPVGVDFTVCVDIGKDGTCDVQSCINIPSTDGGPEGTATGVEVDPLTTIVLAKLHELIEQRNIEPTELPLSPVALVTRVVDAYTHLFEESGIEEEVTLDDIEALDEMELAGLFEEAIPAGAQGGLLVAEGNLDLAAAVDVNEVALAAAKIFVQAGFPIADGPEGLDLTSLTSVPGVEVKTHAELFPEGDDTFTEDFGDVVDEETLEPAGLNPGFQPTLYVNNLSEPDRNFSDDEADGAQPGGPHLPVLHDYLLLEMALLQTENRRITLQDLQDLLTSIDQGLGARLSYFVFNPGFFGPPLNVFETADGVGKAVDLHTLFMQLGEFRGLSREDIEVRQAELRSKLSELLEGTAAPSFDRFAGGFADDQITGVDELAHRVRDARAHLPFSRTGPSTFFVLAEGDEFRGATSVAPVSVDLDTGPDGEVQSVAYNAAGEGKFYLQFTEATQGDGIVSFMVRETGRQLHARQGPVRASIMDTAVFGSVNGASFADFVSETGSFFPGVNVAVVNNEYVPEPAPLAPPPPVDVVTDDGNIPDGSITDGMTDDGTTPDGTVTDDMPSDDTADPPIDPNAPTDDNIAPAEAAPVSPDQQIFVLATSTGSGGEPARVDYDAATGVATYNPAGSNLLQFLPDTQDTGTFGLFNENTGRPARPEDTDILNTPTIPDGFQDVLNDPDALGDLVDMLGDELPPGQDVPQPGPTTDGATGIILVNIDEVVGLPVRRETFTHVFGTEVPNARYNADGDPYFDDFNANGAQDANEPTAPMRPTLFNPLDWRSTDIRLYYRRADNNASVTFEEVDFMAETPRTLDGVALVERAYLPRLNAFRFGRPNTAMNLLTAFLPPEFFDGTHGFTPETPIDIYGAIAIINLMLDQVLNVEAEVDVDGPGPLPSRRVLTNAHVFIAPVGDPFVLLLDGFRAKSVVADAPTDAD